MSAVADAAAAVAQRQLRPAHELGETVLTPTSILYIVFAFWYKLSVDGAQQALISTKLSGWLTCQQCGAIEAVKLASQWRLGVHGN